MQALDFTKAKNVGTQWYYDFGDANWIIQDLIADIKSFTGESHSCIREKMVMGAERVAKLWECEKPATPHDRFLFYKNTDAHLYEGANWHGNYPAPLQRYYVGNQCRGNVLVYGCGIGTEGLFALYNPNVSHVDFTDVNIKNLSFIKHRLDLRGVEESKYSVMLIPENMNDSVKVERPYDTIVCLDVLEHLDDPLATLRLFRTLMNPNGKVIIDAPFDDTAPVGHLMCNKELNLKDMLNKVSINNWEINVLRNGLYERNGNV